MPTTQKATLAEIYNTLNQLVEAYVNVMATFETIVTDVGEMKTTVQQLHGFVNDQFIDAVQARDIWRQNAELHKLEVVELKCQLQAVLGKQP